MVFTYFSSGTRLGCAAPSCSSLTSPIGDGIFILIVGPPQGQCDQAIVPQHTITMNQEIEWVLENRIGQEPGRNPIVAFNEDIIYPRYQEGGILTLLSAVFASSTK